MRGSVMKEAGESMPPKLEDDSKTVRLQLVVSERWLGLIDDWRRKHPNLPNRSEAIRLLVEEGLKDD